MGKELAAIGLAQALVCREKPDEGCGECSSCLRIAHRNHPDVSWVMPQAEMISRGRASRSDFAGAPSREIRVEQIRSLQERLSMHPLEGGRNIAIVPSADEMNTQAQSAFLKTLEEPPSGSVIILLASAPDRMLPTIGSRCSRIDFGPLPANFIAERVRSERKLDAETADLVAVMSGGSMSRALELDLEALGRRKELIAFFEGTDPGNVRGLLAFAEEFGASRERAEDALLVLRLWLRDLAAVQVGARPIANRDLEEMAKQVSAKHTQTALHRRFALVESTAEAIGERNGSPRLQLERMLIEMGRTA